MKRSSKTLTLQRFPTKFTLKLHLNEPLVTNCCSKFKHYPPWVSEKKKSKINVMLMIMKAFTASFVRCFHFRAVVGWHLDKWRELETYLEMRIRILFEFHTGEICLITAAFKSFTQFFLNSVFFYRYLSLNHPQQGIMSYGSIDGGSFGSRNPFGGPTRQGYQPVGKDIGFYEEKHLRHKCVALSNPKHCDNSPIKGTTPSPELLFFFGITLAGSVQLWYHTTLMDL